MKGIYAAAPTPFLNDNRINRKLLEAHCRWLLGNGCDGIVLLGTTGEANSMSVTLRLSLIEELAKGSLPVDKLVIGAGACSAADVRQLTRAALQAGIDKVLVLPPFYYKPVSNDGLLGFFGDIIEKIAQPFSIYLYHIPQISGIGFGFDLIATLLHRFPGHILGIKDSCGDPEHLEHLCREFPQLEVMSGNEAFLMRCIQAGGSGCISATANITAPIIRKLYDALLQDNSAEQLQAEVAGLRESITSFPVVPVLKYLLTYRYREPGWENLLPPLLPLDGNQKKTVQNLLIDSVLKSLF